MRLPRQAAAVDALLERSWQAAQQPDQTHNGVDERQARGGRIVAKRSRDVPLVTCVMPTRDRLPFALQAVRLFQAQCYPNRELMVVDDGADGQLESLLPEDSRVRYVRAPEGESIGMKRNRACAAAQGEFIAQWDDDDWYGSKRLSVQLEPLLAGFADVTGLIAPVFFDLHAWRFWSVTPALHRQLFAEDVHGGTLVYRRQVWERLAHYPNASLAEDAAFLVTAKRRGARLQRINGDGLFVYVRLAHNAWNVDCGQHVDAAEWLCVQEPTLPQVDREFYLERCAAEARGGLATSADRDSRIVPARRRSAVGPTSVSNRSRERYSRDDTHDRPPVVEPLPTKQWSHGNADAKPLVTCIMPTRNRRNIIGRAIGCFQRQDYRERELLILDDGEDPVADLVPVDARIRYVRLEGRLPLGEKRNWACGLARGEVIAHWDDDDWYAENRITYQVGQLRSHGADVCGPSRVLFFEPARRQAWLYAYPTTARSPWVAGSGLCYHVDAWRQHPFPCVDVGEDSDFVRGCRDAPLVLADHRFLVALIHAANTSRKLTSSACWYPRPVAEVRTLLGSDYASYGA